MLGSKHRPTKCDSNPASAKLIRICRIGKAANVQTGQGLNNFHYVCILVGEMDETRHDTGLTDDLDSRRKAHNSGQVSHTSKYLPWRIETAIAFSCREKTADFEKYLKFHSGPIPDVHLQKNA